LKEEDIMLTEYIRAVMKKARYEILPDDNSFMGRFPALTVSMPMLIPLRHAAMN
jgi:hypothetical protein